MSEQNNSVQEDNIREALGITDEHPEEENLAEQEQISGEAEVEETEDNSDDYLAEVSEEDKKYAKGWNPDGPKSLDDFIEKGKMIEQIQTLKTKINKLEPEFQSRLHGLTRMQEAAIQQTIHEYEQKLKDAVNISDYEGVKDAQNKIAKAHQDAADLQPPPPELPDEVKSWNDANPWIFEKTPKAAYAQEIFRNEMAVNNGDAAAALAKVDQTFGNAPAQQQQQAPAPTAPKTMPSQSMPGRRSSTGRLSEKDLTRDEANLLNFMRTEKGFDEKQFFQSVAEIRSVK